MRTYKHVLFSTLFALVAFSAILYTACSKSSDKCTGVVCQNGGSCAGGTCSCPTGYTGSRCETKIPTIQPCDTLVCANGGTCVNGICSCPAGTEGTHCEILSESKFTRTWAAQDQASGVGNLTYSAVITATAGSNTIVHISNMADGFFTHPVTATIDHNTITITSQSPDNDNYTIQGTGIYANGKINWTYSLSNSSGTTVNVTGVWM